MGSAQQREAIWLIHALARVLLVLTATAMSLPKKLLVPTDFGDGSQAALDEAIELAKAFGAEILLLHAYEIPIVGFPDGALVATADLASRIIDGAREGLERVIAQNAGRGVKMTAVLKQGDAPRMIEEAIEEHGAELVVMSTHGRKGFQRAILGSVAEKVVRTAKCPVLTLRGMSLAA
jgi:nucleotide-binding universal stress UspA family protein